MDRVHVDLANCYGIKSLKQDFDFASVNAYAIYAPNGAMKSSFAETFKDIANRRDSRDRIFPGRTTSRKVTDKNGDDLDWKSVLVVEPYDAELGHSERTSTLLVDASLRTEYSKLNAEIQSAKDVLLAALKQQSGGSKKNIEEEISSTFTTSTESFEVAVTRIRAELEKQTDAPFASVIYDKIFDDKVVAGLNAKGLQTLVENYVQRYNELLDASTYFQKGTFDYYNAGEIAKV